ncbi:hypothetical protein BT69DRAFT_1349286 [Atractiella rhizophila]|nr:hypothetical protein BT69DRAFT_1349286 [Atractiella rhizophila]
MHTRRTLVSLATDAQGPAFRTRSKGPPLPRVQSTRNTSKKGKKRVRELDGDESTRRRKRQKSEDSDIQVIESQESELSPFDIPPIESAVSEIASAESASTEGDENALYSDPSRSPSRTISPAPNPLEYTFSNRLSQISIHRSRCRTPREHDSSTPTATPFTKDGKEISASSLAPTEPDLDSSYVIPTLTTPWKNSSTHPDSPTGSLAPTEPPTPDVSFRQPPIRGKKPIPYIVQLPNGGCEYKFPPDADFDYRSPSPTPPPTPKPSQGPMPLRKEERVRIRRPRLVKQEDVEAVYSRENMRAVTVRDFLFPEGEEKRNNPIAWKVKICGGVNEQQWVEAKR